MYADASLVLDQVRGVVVAPIQAVDRAESGSHVLVVGRDGKLDVRTVTVGLETDDRVEIKAGLSDGEIVVVGSRAQLKPGTIVVPKFAAAAGAGER
jgi:multidrug efflux pump subunit AcrA (membrane-fusion protein)